MLARDMLSTALLFFGVVLGPAILLITVVAYGASAGMRWLADYRKRCYVRSLPCTKCGYFTNDEFLPCAVNPLHVLTDEAHSCYDFAAKQESASQVQSEKHQATGSFGGSTVKATRAV